jgi:hypothetical protein
LEKDEWYKDSFQRAIQSDCFHKWEFVVANLVKGRWEKWFKCKRCKKVIRRIYDY